MDFFLKLSPLFLQKEKLFIVLGISQPKGAVYARIVLALIVSTQTPTNRIFFES